MLYARLSMRRTLYARFSRRICLQQERVSAVERGRAGHVSEWRGRFWSVALEHILAPLLGVEQRHADDCALSADKADKAGKTGGGATA